MPNVTVAQPNIGGPLCESSVILFLLSRRIVWLTAAAGKIPSGGKSPRKCIYIVQHPGDGQTSCKVMMQ